LLVVVLALVVGATYLQRGARCPRCNGKIVLTSRLRLPERCRVCAIPFVSSPALPP
jgi:DNA-directed RNA polymerase subunit RPC12/RpoP